VHNVGYNKYFYHIARTYNETKGIKNFTKTENKYGRRQIETNIIISYGM